MSELERQIREIEDSRKVVKQTPAITMISFEMPRVLRQRMEEIIEERRNAERPR